MANQYTETEAKLYVPDLDEVRAKLETLGAHLSAPRVFERNVRYDTLDEKLRAKNGVLRLRQDTRIRLTFKDGERVAGEHGTTRFEAEVEVSDFDVMEVILGKLGYFRFMVYEKYRTTYELHGTEVTLDEMPYGNFVEVEGEDDSIGRVITALELQDAPQFRNSYVVLFENVRRRLNLDIRDLSFENFAGVDVPVIAFSPPLRD